jgi:DNA-directed RNA polymerase specialized sigma subunit, sigma24 homolog
MNAKTAPDYEALIESYYGPLFRFAMSLCGNLESALELTQQTFRKAMERCEPLQEASKARQWLFTILFSEFLQKRRLRKTLFARSQNQFAVAEKHSALKSATRRRL